MALRMFLQSRNFESCPPRNTTLMKNINHYFLCTSDATILIVASVNSYGEGATQCKELYDKANKDNTIDALENFCTYQFIVFGSMIAAFIYSKYERRQ